MSRRKGTGMHWRRLGQLGHTHGELVDFIYWYQHFLSRSFCFHPPLPRSNNGRKTPQSGGSLGQPKAFRALLDGQ